MEIPAVDARESRGLRGQVKIDLDFLLCLLTVLTAIDRKGRVRRVAAFCGNQVEQRENELIVDVVHHGAALAPDFFVARDRS